MIGSTLDYEKVWRSNLDNAAHESETIRNGMNLFKNGGTGGTVTDKKGRKLTTGSEKGQLRNAGDKVTAANAN